MEELPECEMKSKLSAYYDPNIDLKEKLSPVQVAFGLCWLNENPEATGSMLLFSALIKCFEKN